MLSVCLSRTFSLPSLSPSHYSHPSFCSLLHEYAQFGYFPTYHHIAPYCLGTFVGYLILRHQKTPFILSRCTQCLMWILAPAASVGVLFCTKDWNTFEKQITPSLTVAVIYSIFQRILWSFGIAWISFVCATGHGGIVNEILSFKLFIPFSRLSYSIYMVHLIPIFLRVNSMRYTRGWDDFEFVSWGVFNIVLGVFGAYLLYVIFESPINSLEKMFFRPEVKVTVDVLTGDVNNNDTESQSETHDENGVIEQQSVRKSKHPSSDMCPKHAIEPIHDQHQQLPAMTSFAAYKLRTSSMSSGFSDSSAYSFDQQRVHHHQHIHSHTSHPYDRNTDCGHRDVSRRQRM